MTSPVFSVPRPHCKWTDVITTLADFAIITYCVSPEQLSKHLPNGFEPDVYTLADGTRTAFVSAVPFRDLDFRFAGAQWAKFSFGQTNYRAYVKHEGKRCVWFFGTSLDTVFVLIPKHVWQLPWHGAKMDFSTDWSDERFTRYQLTTRSKGANVELNLIFTGESAGTLDGFANADETAEVLTHPLVGYFYRRDGKVGSYCVWHERLVLTRAKVTNSRFQLFEDLGLISKYSVPHSALVQKHTEFVVLLPPVIVT